MRTQQRLSFAKDLEDMPGRLHIHRANGFQVANQIKQGGKKSDKLRRMKLKADAKISLHVYV